MEPKSGSFNFGRFPLGLGFLLILERVCDIPLPCGGVLSEGRESHQAGEQKRDGLGKYSPMAENPDGTYTLQSSLEMNSTEQRNPSAFTCRIVHNSQPPISCAFWIGLFLEKVLTAAFLLFLFLRGSGSRT
ncbi:unnamed protein product, partial [Caretta caretta]